MLKLTKEEIQPDKTSFRADIRESAVSCIKKFFQGRKLSTGGLIPESYLLSQDNIEIVLKAPFDDATFNFLHEFCLPCIPFNPKYKFNEAVPWTVYCLRRLLKKMEKHEIPKDFMPGMLLLYFKLCRGVQIMPVPLL